MCLQYNFWTIWNKIGHCESVELFEINERLEIDWLERNSCRSLFNQPRNLPFWWFIPRKLNLGLAFSCKKWLRVNFLQVILYQSYFFGNEKYHSVYNLKSNWWKMIEKIGIEMPLCDIKLLLINVKKAISNLFVF